METETRLTPEQHPALTTSEARVLRALVRRHLLRPAAEALDARPAELARHLARVLGRLSVNPTSADHGGPVRKV